MKEIEEMITSIWKGKQFVYVSKHGDTIGTIDKILVYSILEHIERGDYTLNDTFQ